MTRPTDHRVIRSDDAHRSGGNLLIWDADPLSLLATAGALHTAGHRCVCARNASATVSAISTPPTPGELPAAMVIDVGDDAPAALQTLALIREMPQTQQLPAVLIASTAWSGLEKRIENLEAPTRCLFKPIDPQSLIAVVDALLWMPALEQKHRRKGTRPGRAGWVSL